MLAKIIILLCLNKNLETYLLLVKQTIATSTKTQIDCIKNKTQQCAELPQLPLRQWSEGTLHFLRWENLVHSLL